VRGVGAGHLVTGQGDPGAGQLGVDGTPEGVDDAAKVIVVGVVHYGYHQISQRLAGEVAADPAQWHHARG
jgi:hypothetical protein